MQVWEIYIALNVERCLFMFVFRMSNEVAKFVHKNRKSYLKLFDLGEIGSH
jgi:hypothetical protein